MPTETAFSDAFCCGRMAGWVNKDVELSHVTFGSVLGRMANHSKHALVKYKTEGPS